MLDATIVDENGCLHAPMEPGYAAFKGAFGGWTAAHALLAAEASAPEGLQPCALTVDFLAAVQPGQVISAPLLLRGTSNLRFVAVDTRQGAALCARSSVLLALPRATERIDAATMPACPRAAELPVLKIDGGPNTWVQRLEQRSAHGTLLQSSPGLRSLTWTRLLDTSPDPHATLAALADASFPRIYFHFAEVTPIATVTMSVHFHADAAEVAKALKDFVLIDASSGAARNGFFDQRVRLWSSQGSLLGSSTQLARYDVAPPPA